jgi:hypothetical protein
VSTLENLPEVEVGRFLDKLKPELLNMLKTSLKEVLSSNNGFGTGPLQPPIPLSMDTNELEMDQDLSMLHVSIDPSILNLNAYGLGGECSDNNLPLVDEAEDFIDFEGLNVEARTSDIPGFDPPGFLPA